MAFKVPNPDAFAFLDQYRGKDFTGTWPTVVEMFEISCKRFGDRPCFKAFHPKELFLTYNEVREKVLQISNYLLSTGVKKGDKIAVSGKNSPEWAIAYLAVLYAGAIVVPLDITYNDTDMETLMAFGGVSRIFIDSDRVDNVGTKTGKVSLVEKYSLEEGNRNYPYLFSLSAEGKFTPEKAVEDDVAAILFTSGTTGNEKGAVLSHRNITSNVYQAANGMHVDETDVLYALLPLHHSYCCTAVLLETIRHGADCLFGHGIIVSRMIADMKMGKVTVFMGIPLLYNKVIAGIFKQVKAKGPFVYGLVRFLMIINGWCKKIFGKAPFKKFFDKMITSKVGLDHSKVLICGAGPLSPTVFKQYQQLGLNFLQGYGLTETAPILTLNPPEHFKIDSVGRVLNFIDMKIADKDSEGVGEIRVKGPNICRGYLDDEENTKALFDEEGYLRTGDLGYLDSENYLYLKGRAKNIIVTEGGKNVFPEEIEDMFQLYQQIDQILIRGYQQKKDVPCESIEAVIYPSDEYYKDKGMTKEAIEKEIEGIVTEVNRGLVGYKKIEKVTFVDKPMEVTTTKKIKRGLVK